MEPSSSSKDEEHQPEDKPRQPVELRWEHGANGSFIRREFTEVALVFDSAARVWRLRISKLKTPLGHPVSYEIVFKEQYAPTPEKAIELANQILDVELRDE